MDVSHSQHVTGAQCVSRAVRILRIVGRNQAKGIGLSDLTREVGLSKPTIHRLLGALKEEGLIEQDATTRRYFLGVACFVFGNIASARFGVSRIVAPMIARIARECGDTAFFSIRVENMSECVLREDGDYPIKTHVLMPGDRHPLGVGAGSLAILAAMKDDEIDDYLGKNADYIAANYPLHPVSSIREGIEETRRCGFSVNRGKVVAGSWGIGIAICDDEGRPFGALSIAAIEARLSDARQLELAQLLRREVRRFDESAAVANGLPRHSAEVARLERFRACTAVP
jgi:DNA-binding IclR family transcriptional regulator